MKIIVPATTSNIASGFDVLGIALDIFLEVEFFVDSNKFKIEGCPYEYCNEENFIVKGIKKVFNLYSPDYWSKVKDKLYINIKSDIPIARGLGSSASCIAAGLIFANEYLYYNEKIEKLSLNNLIKLGTELEGHPDNISAAILGGVTSSCIDKENGKIYSQKILFDYDFLENFNFYLFIPDFEVKTEHARKILPKNIEFNDAVFNLSRLAILFTAIINKDEDLFPIAFEDRLHQVYRKNLIKNYDHVILKAKENGAIATFISVSGSTLVAITKNNNQNNNSNFEEKMQDFFDSFKENHKTCWQVKKVKIYNEGAKVFL